MASPLPIADGKEGAVHRLVIVVLSLLICGAARGARQGQQPLAFDAVSIKE